MAEYEYDENLPYVVESVVRDEGGLIARFARRNDAEHAVIQAFNARVIDTTPKPRIPDDAKFISWTYPESGLICAAARGIDGWHYDGDYNLTSEELIANYIEDEAVTVLDVRADQ